MGFLGRIRQSVIHEGDGMAISRADGSRTEQDFEQICAHFEISWSEFAGLSIPAILEKLQYVAEELARGRTQHAFSTIDASCEEVGNVVDAAGGPLTPDLILQAWEQMEIAFDVDGRPRMPTLVIHPEAGEAVREIFSRLETDPDLKRRADNIIERKRGEWIARETDRTLVG